MRVNGNHVEMLELESKQTLLKRFATRYIWWETSDIAERRPRRVIAQVMNLGDYEDALALSEAFGDGELKSVLAKAEAGEFNERSWHYWHFKLGMSTLGKVPPLPRRSFK